MGAEGGEAIVGESWDGAPFLRWSSGRSSHRLIREAIEATHTIISMLQNSLIFAMKRKLAQILYLVYSIKIHNHSAGPTKAALPSVLLEFTS